MGAVPVRGRLYRRRYLQDGLRLILVQRRAAFPAEIVSGPELDEMTMVATYHFPGIDRRQSCSHELFRRCQSRQTPKPLLYRGPINSRSFRHEFTIVNGKIR